jgi:chloramphenicol-sensitive protein RarD
MSANDVTTDGAVGEEAGGSRFSAGLVYGLSAYGIWGLTPIYFKVVAAVPPLEVLAHRIVWSVVILFGLLLAQRSLRDAVDVLRDRRTVAVLTFTTILIGCNWFVFIWAVVTDRLLQTSLGYFINPLISVLLGVVVLKERLSRAEKVAVGLAAVAVAYETALAGELPWIALFLATSFAFYGLLRKTTKAGAVVGLAVETAVLFPVAVGYLWWLRISGDLRFVAGDPGLDLLMVSAGVVTSVPLLLFTKAARLLPLSVVGFLQYIAPSMTFILAVVFYGEVLDVHTMLTFSCIWIALAIFTVDRVRRSPAA